MLPYIVQTCNICTCTFNTNNIVHTNWIILHTGVVHQISIQLIAYVVIAGCSSRIHSIVLLWKTFLDHVLLSILKAIKSLFNSNFCYHTISLNGRRTHFSKFGYDTDTGYKDICGKLKVILCASEHICSIVRYCFRSFKQL